MWPTADSLMRVGVSTYPGKTTNGVRDRTVRGHGDLKAYYAEMGSVNLCSGLWCAEPSRPGGPCTDATRSAACPR